MDWTAVASRTASDHNRIPVRIFWRETATGKVGVHEAAVYADPFSNDPEKPSFFWWLEGNGSCDCNRGLMFLPEEHQIENEDGPEYCGDGRFRLTRIEWPGGAEDFSEGA